MRTAPDFWWRPDRGWQARLLAPIGGVYGRVTAERMSKAGMRLAVPVICVGNFVAGGAGKTPTALALARLLIERGHRPAFLSRGYGGSGASRAAVLRVDPAAPDPGRTGDEPLLLAAVAPTFVSRDRVGAARAALAEGAGVLILDDGLQNPALAKTMSVAVVDGARGFGNEACLPAGPMRAPAEAQWPHVAALCVIGEGEPGQRAAAAAFAHGVLVWPARLVPDPAAVTRLRGKPLLAFAGIGHPGKFFTTLGQAGLDVRATRAFPDHHRFSQADLATLTRVAQENGATLVTTDKDRVRLRPDFAAEVLPVALSFADPGAVQARLVEAMAGFLA